MEKTQCPACGLKMDPGAFGNCPQCHALIVEEIADLSPPARVTGASPTGGQPEPDPELDAVAAVDDAAQALAEDDALS